MVGYSGILKSRYWEGNRHTKDLLGEMPVKDKEECEGKRRNGQEKPLDYSASPDTYKGEQDRSKFQISILFWESFGQIDGESLNQNFPLKKPHIPQMDSNGTPTVSVIGRERGIWASSGEYRRAALELSVKKVLAARDLSGTFPRPPHTVCDALPDLPPVSLSELISSHPPFSHSTHVTSALLLSPP